MYYLSAEMAAERTNTQTLITAHVDDTLLNAVETCRRRGGKTRAQWMREAILEKLRAEGIPLPEEAAHAPDRAGKGGRKRAMPEALLNESGTTAPAAKAARKKVTYKAAKNKGDG